MNGWIDLEASIHYFLPRDHSFINQNSSQQMSDLNVDFVSGTPINKIHEQTGQVSVVPVQLNLPYRDVVKLQMAGTKHILFEQSRAVS